MGLIIDGKKIANETLEEIRDEVEKLKKSGIIPTLAVVIVGDNKASKIYVNNKRDKCQSLGIRSLEYSLDKSASMKTILDLIDKLNRDKSVNGILVQLPLPTGLDENEIIANIDPLKDVDAFHNINSGKVMTGNFEFIPCTPAGIIELLTREGIDLESKHCVVVGRSNIVGKPMAMLLLHNNATVTICHSKTKNLDKICSSADILIVAIGKPKYITSKFISPGTVVIDVGMNRDQNGKLCGDVDFDNVKDKTRYITPVPGGVGPMTIAMLMKNTIKACYMQNPNLSINSDKE